MTTSARTPLERITTGVPGLDTILSSGFVRGGIYLLMGKPGTGKTTLGNQMCFHHASHGGRAVYLTLLAESHAQMLRHLEGFSFFRPEAVGAAVTYVSGFQALESRKMEGLLSLIRHTLRDQKASLLVIDGLLTASSAAASDLELKRFIHELETLTSLLGVTSLLLTGADPTDANYPERTMVDGILSLNLGRSGMRSVRELEIVKFRGSGSRIGRHVYDITDEGLTVYPRLESHYAEVVVPERPRAQVGFGIPSLDAPLHGGLNSDTCTLVLGAPGIGKTLLGLHFLAAGAKRDEPGLYLGFFEHLPRLVERAESIGLKVGADLERGMLSLLWHQPTEHLADALAARWLATIGKKAIRRVVIDGLGVLSASLLYPERSVSFFTALTNALRALGATTLFIEGTPNVSDGQLDVQSRDLLALSENIILMRYQQVEARRHRLLSFVKLRDLAYDDAIREVSITSRGMEVSDPFLTVGVATDHAAKLASKKRKPLSARRQR